MGMVAIPLRILRRRVVSTLGTGYKPFVCISFRNPWDSLFFILFYFILFYFCFTSKDLPRYHIVSVEFLYQYVANFLSMYDNNNNNNNSNNN